MGALLTGFWALGGADDQGGSGCLYATHRPSVRQRGVIFGKQREGFFGAKGVSRILAISSPRGVVSGLAVRCPEQLKGSQGDFAEVIGSDHCWAYLRRSNNWLRHS